MNRTCLPQVAVSRCALIGLALALVAGAVAHSQGVPAGADAANHLTFDLRQPGAPPQTGYLDLGGRSSTGHDLEVNSQYLVLDGKPWLPVMGEFHYSRYPEKDWETEILKMKAAGVQIVSTYVFWIHQEEIEGEFDWTGQRDLRRFVELCGKHGMYVFLRIGPWEHSGIVDGVPVVHSGGNDSVHPEEDAGCGASTAGGIGAGIFLETASDCDGGRCFRCWRAVGQIRRSRPNWASPWLQSNAT